MDERTHNGACGQLALAQTGRGRPRSLGGHLNGLVDQFLISGASFVTIIVLARISEQRLVGQIALILNLVTLCLLFHQAVWTAFTVFVARGTRSAKLHHLHHFLVLHAPVGGALIVGFLWVLFLSWENAPQSVKPLGLVVTLISASLLYEVLRRTYWAFERGDRAATLGAIRAAVFLLGILYLSTLDSKISLIAALIWLISARLVAIPGLINLWWATANLGVRPVRTAIPEYWDFAKWAWLRTLFSYLAGNVYVPLVALVLGFSAAGEFEVGRQLVAPFYIIPMGLTSYLLPKLARKHFNPASSNFNAALRRIALFWVSGFFLLSALLYFFGASVLLSLLGPNSAYGELGGMVLPLAVLGFAVSINCLAELVIYSINRPELGWMPMAIAMVANGTIGVPLLLRFGVVGAFAGNAVANTISAGLVLWKVKKALCH